MDLSKFTLEDFILRASYITLEDKQNILKKLPSLREYEKKELYKVFFDTELALMKIEKKSNKAWDEYGASLKQIAATAENYA